MKTYVLEYRKDNIIYNTDITKDMFDKLIVAKIKLECASEYERFMRVCILNYTDFEKYLLSVSFHGFNKQYNEYNNQQLILLEINRFLNNLFASIRAYRDISSSLIKRIAGKVVSEKFEGCRSHYYDIEPSYKYMESLRDYAQHNNNVITSFSIIDSNSTDINVLPLFYPNLSQLDKTCFEKVKNIIRDMELQKEKHNMKFHVRKYMEAISQIHKEGQLLIKDEIESCHIKIKSILDEQKVNMFTIFESDNPQDRKSRYNENNFLEKSINYNSELSRRNKPLINLYRRSITN